MLILTKEQANKIEEAKEVIRRIEYGYKNNLIVIKLIKEKILTEDTVEAAKVQNAISEIDSLVGNMELLLCFAIDYTESDSPKLVDSKNWEIIDDDELEYVIDKIIEKSYNIVFTLGEIKSILKIECEEFADRRTVNGNVMDIRDATRQILEVFRDLMNKK